MPSVPSSGHPPVPCRLIVCDCAKKTNRYYIEITCTAAANGSVLIGLGFTNPSLPERGEPPVPPAGAKFIGVVGSV